MLDLTGLGPWRDLLQEALSQPWAEELFQKVEASYEAGEVFPPKEAIFTAFRLTPPEAVRVVILGQDPYHEPGQAQGLAFSVAPGVKTPPSLRNMDAERQTDLGLPPLKNGDLSGWARQGVFLLNTVLTVEAGKANSHKDLGWQRLTDAVFASLSDLPQPVAFVLWGKQAQEKAALAASSPYPRLVLQAPHPSPLSAYRGFFGSRPYSKINAFLRQHGEREIVW